MPIHVEVKYNRVKVHAAILSTHNSNTMTSNCSIFILYIPFQEDFANYL